MDTTAVRTEEKPVAPQSVTLESAALARILEEVKNDVVCAPNAYNRMHNRHNR